MKHIFISHAGRDSEIAKRLYNDLKMVGHDVYIDLEELKLGNDTIDFMNNAIKESHTVIIIYSENTPDAAWQKLEIKAAVWNSVSHGGTIIVLKLGSVELPPLLGPRLYASLDDDTYRDTVQRLCSEITQQKSETSKINEALKKGSSNPFWRVRAEYFDEKDPRLLAKSFSPPDAAKIQMLEEMKPCFLEGSRGTGKTMLLLSLRARILSARVDSPKKISDIFGCYVRLDRGALCNAGTNLTSHDHTVKIEGKTLNRLIETFSQEFYLGTIESLVSEISHCARDNKLIVDPASETRLIQSIVGAIAQPATGSQPGAGSVYRFEDLLEYLSNMRRQLSGFIRRSFIYEEEVVRVPFVCFDIDMFKRIIRLIRSQIPILGSSHVTILLDEYENLLAYQKLVVNTLVKFGPPEISVKVARKVGSEEVSGTIVEQELQETHDYNRVTLIYPVERESDFARYIALLENMVGRLFSSQDLIEISLEDLLPRAVDDEIPHEMVKNEVVRLVTSDRFESWNMQKQNKKLSYYRDAAIYRQLSGKRTKKRFSGHKELAFISSGVIRYFQEILGMAYYLQSNGAGDVLQSIDPSFQTEAVHAVSNHNLATLSRNVETYGEKLKYFLLDLGDCLRQKLLNHSSEPEAARLALRDPELLMNPDYELLSRMIGVGIKEGVFQLVDGRPGLRPKHIQDPQPADINVARIYAPALEISPRLRWRSEVSCVELMGLLDDSRRKITKRALINRFASRSESQWSEGSLPFDGLEEDR